MLRTAKAVLAQRRKKDRDRKRAYRASVKESGIPTRSQVAEALVVGVKCAIEAQGGMPAIEPGTSLELVVRETMLALQSQGYDITALPVRRTVHAAITTI